MCMLSVLSCGNCGLSQSHFFGKNVHYVVTKVIDGKRPDLQVEGRPDMPDFLVKLTNLCWHDDVKIRPEVSEAGEMFDEGKPVLCPELAAAAEEEEDAFDGDGIMMVGTPTVNKNAIQNVENFLKSCGLSKYNAAIIENGFMDMESLCDREVL
eukprot:533451_1